MQYAGEHAEYSQNCMLLGCAIPCPLALHHDGYDRTNNMSMAMVYHYSWLIDYGDYANRISSINMAPWFMSRYRSHVPTAGCSAAKAERKGTALELPARALDGRHPMIHVGDRLWRFLLSPVWGPQIQMLCLITIKVSNDLDYLRVPYDLRNHHVCIWWSWFINPIPIATFILNWYPKCYVVHNALIISLDLATIYSYIHTYS